MTAPWSRLPQSELGETLAHAHALLCDKLPRIDKGLLSASDIAGITRVFRQWLADSESQSLAGNDPFMAAEARTILAKAVDSILGPEPSKPFTLDDVNEAEAILANEARLAKILASVKIQSASELGLKKLSPPRMTVEALLPEGLGKLAAPPKAGKSWASLSLLISVATGEPAFGHFPIAQGDCLGLFLEDSDRRLQGRIERQGGVFPANLDIITEIPQGVRLAELCDAWAASRLSPKMIVVDTLGRALRGVDLMDYQAVTAALDPLQRLAFKYGMTILFIHHTRKGMGDGDIFDTSLGSQGLFGAMDVDLVLQRKRGEDTAVLHVTGREIGDASYSLKLHPETMTWETTDRPPEETLQGPERRAILEILHNAGPEGAKTGNIASTLGRAPSTVSTLLKKLKDDGLCAQGKYGFWKAIESMETVESKEGAKVKEGPAAFDTFDTFYDVSISGTTHASEDGGQIANQVPENLTLLETPDTTESDLGVF